MRRLNSHSAEITAREPFCEIADLDHLAGAQAIPCRLTAKRRRRLDQEAKHRPRAVAKQLEQLRQARKRATMGPGSRSAWSCIA
jgi:hypothetical protein